jgi:mono/diheme cytochrome c family protein
MVTLRVLAVLSVVGLSIFVYALWGRSGAQVHMTSVAASPAIPLAQLTQERPVDQIQLEYHEPDLPPGPAHDLVAAQCIICHSTRYVLNQPVFPRKTWTAEVHKMVKAYGAMIQPDQEKEIVDYLVTWHGKEDPPPAASSK